MRVAGDAGGEVLDRLLAAGYDAVALPGATGSVRAPATVLLVPADEARLDGLLALLGSPLEGGRELEGRLWVLPIDALHEL